MDFVKFATQKNYLKEKLCLLKQMDLQFYLPKSEGEYYAIGNKCTHRGCKLSNGTLNGDIIKCKCHGSSFNVKTGEAVHGPASKPEPKYTVKVEEDQILVSI
jgi:nitrite reductase/ring-hydroxylating ferredoxin subunit